jgi:hypothetical protein
MSIADMPNLEYAMNNHELHLLRSEIAQREARICRIVKRQKVLMPEESKLPNRKERV